MLLYNDTYLFVKLAIIFLNILLKLLMLFRAGQLALLEARHGPR